MRRCKECSGPISRHNPNDTCWLHTEAVVHPIVTHEHWCLDCGIRLKNSHNAPRCHRCKAFRARFAGCS